MRGCGRLAGAALAAALAVAGCGDRSAPARYGDDVPREQRYGGTAVVAGAGQAPSLDPFALTDYASRQLATRVLFTPLVTLDADQRPRPWLARSWEREGDRVTFHLRDDVRWHDGEPVTARDVAFTFRAATDPEVGAPLAYRLSAWDSVEVVDEHTVRFRVDPGADMETGLFAWAMTPVAPEHLLGGMTASELASSPFGTDAPVGSGPFRFVEHRVGDRWVFEANPDFPEELGGRPYLDRLVYRVVPEESTLLAELRSGEVDLYMKVLPTQVERIRRDPDLRLATFDFPQYGFVVWNTRRAPFDRETVRAALTLGIDREEIVQSELRGLGAPATGPLGPWHWAYDSTRRPAPYDPDSARALLEGLGWRDTDGDGVREKDGGELAFELLAPDNRLPSAVSVLLQAQLNEVGVAVRPRVREWASMVGALTGEARDFDAAVLSFQPDLVVDDRDLWQCERSDHPLHLSGWCDPRLDTVMDSLTLALDRETRRRLLRRYDELVYRAHPFTFLYFEARADGLRRSLRGVELDPRGELVSVTEWWIHPDAR